MAQGRGHPRWQVRLSTRTKRELFAYLAVSPWLINFIFFILLSMLASLGISLFETNLLSRWDFVGLGNYQALAEDELFVQALINTAYYSLAMVPLGTAVALVIALILNQGIRFQGFFRTVYYVPSIVSGVAVSILWAWMYHPDFGLINSLFDLVGLYNVIPRIRWIYSEVWAMPSLIIMSLWGTGGAMLIFLAGLQSIPTALYEAATIDGAGGWKRFWNITLPMLTPTLLFSIIMRIIGSFQVFTQAYIMTQGGPSNATLTMVLLIFNKSFMQFRFGYASAIAWVLFIIILVFTLLVFRSSESWVYYEGRIAR
jgi:multiple sugar transport system permease protein